MLDFKTCCVQNYQKLCILKMVLEVGEKPQISIWDKIEKNIIPEAYTTIVTLIGYVAIT